MVICFSHIDLWGRFYVYLLSAHLSILNNITLSVVSKYCCFFFLHKAYAFMLCLSNLLLAREGKRSRHSLDQTLHMQSISGLGDQKTESKAIMYQRNPHSELRLNPTKLELTPDHTCTVCSLPMKWLKCAKGKKNQRSEKSLGSRFLFTELG